MYKLIYKTHELIYTVRRSVRAKRTSIKISSKGIEIVLSKRGSLKQAQIFAEKKAKWVYEAWQRISQNKPIDQLRQNIFERSEIFYRGKLLDFEIKTSKKVVMPELHITDSFGIVVPELMPEAKYKLAIKKLLRQKLTLELENEIKKLLLIYKDKLKLSPKSFKIKLHKSKWGSCSTRGNINMNLSLIFAPYEVLEYVLVHELCHLRHHNHSKNFWKLVASMVPDYKMRKAWLKKHQEIIHYLEG